MIDPTAITCTVALKSLEKKWIHVHMSTYLPKGTYTFYIPLWRPGRYTKAPYHTKIHEFNFGKSSEVTSWDTNSTTLAVEEDGTIEWSYLFDADQFDAGSTYVSASFCILNPINFIVMIQGFENKRLDFRISGFESYQPFGTLLKKQEQGVALNYYEVIDRPLLLSCRFSEVNYEVKGIRFSVIFAWEKERVVPEKVVQDFRSFTETQLSMFGDMDEEEYCFLICSPEQWNYHGVEHADNTMILLGASDRLFEENYQHLLGVSSHELFHVWNAIKIRPKALCPYPLHEPVKFQEGWVMEGFTTYYGDLLLYRAGVFTQHDYFRELEGLIQRHLYNPNKQDQHLIETSEVLWEKGYTRNSPPDSLSIYTEGALFSFCMDVALLEFTQGKVSLDDVLRIMWERYGKAGEGYTHKELRDVFIEFHPSCEYLFDSLVYKQDNLYKWTRHSLSRLGIECSFSWEMGALRHEYGMIIRENTWVWAWPGVQFPDPLQPGDRIELISSTSENLHISINGQEKVWPRGDNRYFPGVALKRNDNPNKDQATLFERWSYRSSS